MHSNEKLISEVFGAMALHRPALRQLLEAAEDDFGEGGDLRLMGDMVIKNFPWPIGVELRRLLSGSMRQPDRMRLDQTFKTIERTMQLLAFALVIDLWEHSRKMSIKLPDGFRSEFAHRFAQLTMGNLAWLVRACAKAGKDSGMNWFMVETGDSLTKSLLDSLDFWVPERNEIGHYLINLNQEEIERRCIEYGDRLTELLSRVSFLVKYHLVSVRVIRVNHSRIEEPSFSHTIDLLNSYDSDFKSRELVDSRFTDSNSVLLTKSLKNLDDHLNLTPLIIDTHGEVIDSREKLEVKKDVFLYSSFRHGQLNYMGTEVTRQCDLSTLSHYDRLTAEVGAIFQDLGVEKMEGVS